MTINVGHGVEVQTTSFSLQYRTHDDTVPYTRITTL